MSYTPRGDRWRTSCTGAVRDDADADLRTKMENTMNIRTAILAACPGTLMLMLMATLAYAGDPGVDIYICAHTAKIVPA
jgi:hypothetical protein